MSNVIPFSRGRKRTPRVPPRPPHVPPVVVRSYPAMPGCRLFRSVGDEVFSEPILFFAVVREGRPGRTRDRHVAMISGEYGDLVPHVTERDTSRIAGPGMVAIWDGLGFVLRHERDTRPVPSAFEPRRGCRA